MSTGWWIITDNGLHGQIAFWEERSHEELNVLLGEDLVGWQSIVSYIWMTLLLTKSGACHLFSKSQVKRCVDLNWILRRHLHVSTVSTLTLFKTRFFCNVFFYFLLGKDPLRVAVVLQNRTFHSPRSHLRPFWKMKWRKIEITKWWNNEIMKHRNNEITKLWNNEIMK